MASVKQTAANAFEVTFTADASKTITKDSFTSIETEDKIYSAYVKSVEFSADELTAKVTVLNNFVDAKVYNVTCAEKTASFTASVGAVKTAVINTVQAQAKVATDIEFTFYDENGIDVTSTVKIDDYVKLSIDGTYSVDTNLSPASKAKIVMDEVGDVATVTLTYDPQTTSDAVVTATATIVGAATQATMDSKICFTKVATESDVPKVYRTKSFSADTVLYEEGEDGNFFFTAFDKNGNAIEYDEYTVESANKNIITVGGNSSNNSKYAQFSVSPVKEGSAKVVIHATKNGVESVYSETVTVKAEKRLGTVTLNKTTATIGDNEVHNSNNYVSVTVKDQYGNKLTDDVSISASVTGGSGKDKLDASADGNVVLAKYKENATGAAIGTVTVEVSYKDKEVKKNFQIKGQHVDNATVPSFELELSEKTIDLDPSVRSASGNVQGTVETRIAVYRGKVFDCYVGSGSAISGGGVSGSSGYGKSTGGETITLSAVTVRVKKGSSYYINGEVTSNGAITGNAVSAGSILVNPEDTEPGSEDINTSAVITTVAIGENNTIKMESASLKGGEGIAATGDYTVEAEIVVSGKGITAPVKSLKTAKFKVQDNTELPAVTVNATSGEETGIDLIKECVTVNSDVFKSADDGSSIVDILDKNLKPAEDQDGKGLSVRYIVVEDTFANHDGTETYTYQYYISLNRLFKTKY